jgi:xanthine dehydrogenase accessory factor
LIEIIRAWLLLKVALTLQHPMPPDIFEQILTLRRDGRAHVLVVAAEVLGSTPQDAGAKMLVTPEGRLAGTVGGGKIEAAAIRHAQTLIAGPAMDSAPQLVRWNLKRDIGMTCGGTMTLYFETFHGQPAWQLVIFGAGHVAQALVRVLIPLPCHILCLDSRAEWIAQLPTAPNLEARIESDLPALVSSLPDSAFTILITQGHATDFPILERILATRSLPFVGVIGSRAKRVTLEKELLAAGIPPGRHAEFECPLGLPFGSNHPHEIALSIAARLLQARDAAPATRSVPECCLR